MKEKISLNKSTLRFPIASESANHETCILGKIEFVMRFLSSYREMLNAKNAVFINYAQIRYIYHMYGLTFFV